MRCSKPSPPSTTSDPRFRVLDRSGAAREKSNSGNLTFAMATPPVLHDISLRHPGRIKPGDCWADGLGQIDARESDPAALRRARGDAADRRPASSRVSAGRAAAQYRHGAAGDLSIQRDHPREPGLRRAERAAEELLEAAEAAHIRQEFEEFPQGFETMVGERGVTLSGGQKQRSAIARALMRRPAILILDDALASVDTYTEERILGGLRSYTATRPRF